MKKNKVKIGQKFTNIVNGMVFEVLDIGFDSVWIKYKNGIKDAYLIMNLQGEVK